jgi:hypothetical protein
MKIKSAIVTRSTSNRHAHATFAAPRLSLIDTLSGRISSSAPYRLDPIEAPQFE